MDVMEIDDDLYLNKNLTMEGLFPKDFRRKKGPSRYLTVSLGLLCAVLFAGNIGAITYYEIMIHPSSADPTQASFNAQADRLQSGSEALSAERKHCEARLRNTTEENNQLNNHLNSLTSERDQFKTGLNKMKNERDQIQASYNTSKRDIVQLQTSYNDMQGNLKDLQSDYSNVTASEYQLQIKYSNLQRGNSELQTSFHQLQRNHSSLKRDKDQLQRSYNTLNNGKNRLQMSHNSLWNDKERLQTSYNDLQREKEQLLTNYSSLVTDMDQLQKLIDTLRQSQLCQTGWEKFDNSCYFVSSMKKNWTLGRQDCIAKGADLIVINSRDEQVFINGLVTSDQNAWIGLSDSLEEGNWMWVDRTPVTTDFWQPGQPNSYNGNQDCGELVSQASGVGEWNDDGCFAEQIWICEK